jgi:hypothetical protein
VNILVVVGCGSNGVLHEQAVIFQAAIDGEDDTQYIYIQQSKAT